MKIRFLIERGDDPDDVWQRHARAYVRAGMCPRDGQQLDAYGRCHPAHGRWELTDDGLLRWDA